MQKKMFLIVLAVALIATPFMAAQVAPQPPFHRGVNLSGWFEQPSPREIRFTRFGRQDFQNIKSLGADAIRLPIKLLEMTSGAPDYKLDPLFLGFLDEVVGWAEAMQLYLILDNHTFDSAKPTDPGIEQALLKIWPQMAAHYKERSEFILYEVLNEPHGIDLAKWGRIQGNVIQAIRAVDQKHIIVVGAANWNTYNDLASLPVYPDKNLIYTFHFYDPFLFTHQGASWTDQAAVAGIPFPPDAARMPAVPKQLRNTWVEKKFSNYPKDGSPAEVQRLINIAVDFGRTRQVPIWCGEFGAYLLKSDPADRVAWYKMVREYLESQNIAWTSWDYFGGFGLFKDEPGGDFASDLNIPLIQALGFTPPPQQPRVQLPETTPLDIYHDFPGPGISSGRWGDKDFADYYATDNPATGKFSIHFSRGPRYSSIVFEFAHLRDFSRLLDQAAALEFKVRTAGKPGKLEIRFVNPGVAAADLPWRNAVTFQNTPGNAWQTVRIPLGNFQETGAWKGKWFTALGQFDWTRIQRLEFVAEFQDLAGMDFWFDDIRVVQ